MRATAAASAMRSSLGSSVTVSGAGSARATTGSTDGATEFDAGITWVVEMVRGVASALRLSMIRPQFVVSELETRAVTIPLRRMVRGLIWSRCHHTCCCHACHDGSLHAEVAVL